MTLLRAAEEVFAERGLAGAKVDEIADRAGVSNGAFYQHFENKEAALRQLVEPFLERVQSFFAPPSAYPEPPEDLPGVLDFVLQRDLRLFELLWENRALVRSMPSVHSDDGYPVIAFRAEIAANTRAWVEHWRREGIFREDVDPELATTLIGGAYHELSLRVNGSEQRPPLEEWLAFAQETFFRAFGTAEVALALDRRHRPRGRAPSSHPAA